MALIDNLISYWKLDEVSGTRIDSIGANNLTDNNTVTQASGKIGNAANFVASNSEYLSSASNDFHTGDIDFTFAGWFYFDTVPGGGSYVDILSKHGNSADREYVLELDGDVHRFIWYVRSPDNSAWGTAIANNFGAPSTGNWIFIVAWHDSVNNQIGIQINDGTANITSWSSGVRSTGSATFNLGGLGNLGYWFLNGKIDEIGFWKRVLTSTERTILYNGITYPFTTDTSSMFNVF